MHARVLLICTLFLAGFGGSGIAKAEGRCPPGSYPIGSESGVMGCAPIPGANSGGSTGEWQPPIFTNVRKLIVPQWGAVARSPSGREVGWSMHEYKQATADKKALKACKKRSGQTCAIVASYSNQCAVVIQNWEDGTFLVSVNGMEDMGNLVQIGQDMCPGDRCQSVLSYCTGPYDRLGDYPDYLGRDSAP